MQNAKKLWLTRPVDDSEHLADDLARHGVASLIAPVKTVIRQPFSSVIERPDAILITSRHAAYALAELPFEWRALPVYCVGQSTAEYVREYGYEHLVPGTSDVLALLPRIALDIARGGRLLYLAGEDRRVDVAALLSMREIAVTTLIVYRAATETSLAPALQEALSQQQVDSVAFFSPRSAEAAIGLMRAHDLLHHAPQMEAFCFSLSIAKAAGALPWKALHVSDSPTRDAMIHLIVSKRTTS